MVLQVIQLKQLSSSHQSTAFHPLELRYSYDVHMPSDIVIVASELRRCCYCNVRTSCNNHTHP
jgi:hypothetical protein